jgi:hypothetical protein
MPRTSRSLRPTAVRPSQPAQTCVFTVSFTPSASGARTASISVVSDNGGNVGTNISAFGLPPVELTACGFSESSTAGTPPAYAPPRPIASLSSLATTSTGVALLRSPTYTDIDSDDRTGLDFGQVSIGADCNPMNVKWFRATINSSTAADHMNLITSILTDPSTPANFRILTDTCNNTNEDVSKAAVHCWISVQFRPQGTVQNAKTATVQASGASGGLASLPVTGTATGPLTIHSATNDFGTVVVNEAAATTVSLTVNNWGTVNSLGPVSVAVTGNAGDFRLVFDSCTDNTLTKQANTTCAYATTGNGCVLGYRFYPAAVGARAATVTVTAGTATSTATLSGVGVGETVITSAPASAAFGPIVLSNKSDWQTITVTAGSGGVETGNLLFNIVGPNADQFELGTDALAGTCGNTDTIRLGGANPASCTVKLRFIPRGNVGTAGRASGLGDQKATLTIIDPRDRTITNKIALTGTGTSQLTITPTTVDFGIVGLNDVVTKQLTFTVTNSGADAIASPTLTIAGELNNQGTPSPFAVSAAAATTCVAGTTLSAGATCVILANWSPSVTVTQPGFFSLNPGVEFRGATGSGAAANDSSTAAVISYTVQNNAKLELVGLFAAADKAAAALTFGTTGSALNLGTAQVGGTGQRATLLFRNAGGHVTAPLDYYFWDGVTAGGTPPSHSGLQVNTADANFAVVAGDPTADACVGKQLKAGEYCIVQIDFKPTVAATITSGAAVGFELLADQGGQGGSVKAVALTGRGILSSTLADQYTVTASSDVSAMLTHPVSVGATGAETGTTKVSFDIKNISSATSYFTLATSTGFSILSGDNGCALDTTYTAAYSLSANQICTVKVVFTPAGSTAAAVPPIFRPGTLTVTPYSYTHVAGGPATITATQTGAFSAYLMGKVRQGTVLEIWDPATGTNFGNVTRTTASAAMPFMVKSIGDADTTGNVTVKTNGTAALVPQFIATGCGAALTAFNPLSPSTASSCTASVVFTPTASTAGAISGSVYLEADAAGMDYSNTAYTSSTPSLYATSDANSMAGTVMLAASIGVTPTAYSFADVVAVGQESVTKYTVTITNGAIGSTDHYQSTSAITISLSETTDFVLDLNGTNTPFNSCQKTKDQVTGALILNSDQSCTAVVRFMPQTSGALSTILTATATTGLTQSITINGTARDDLSVTTPATTPPTIATYTFASTAVGTAYSSLPTTSIVITNGGSAQSGFLSTAITGDYIVMSDTCQGVALNAAATCTVEVMFVPTATGDRKGTLSVTGAPGGTASIKLDGTGS